MSEPLSGPLVVVGAGLAGLRVAEGARKAGFAGRIVLVSDEPHAPYDRPPLSKGVLLNEGHEREILLEPGGSLAEQAIEFVSGQAVVGIDRAARRIRLASDETIEYGRLALATGSRVRSLDLLPVGTDGVFYLRGLDDSLALRNALSKAGRVAIVGGGVIGLEVAAAASQGRHVTVVEAQPRLMARMVCSAVSDFIEQRHRTAGVLLRLGVSLVDARRRNCGGWSLHLSDGTELESDIVVAGVGVVPNIELAQAAGLEVAAGGILTDGFGQTSDPSIFAAGEVALHVNAQSARHDRQETWAHAAAHGEHVGRSMIEPREQYAETSSFWSDQYDVNLQVFGAHAGETDIVRGDAASGRFLVFHLAAGKVAGVSAINSARDLRAAKKLVGQPIPADPSRLADAASPIRATV